MIKGLAASFSGTLLKIIDKKKLNHYELSWVYRVHRNCIDFLSKIER